VLAIAGDTCGCCGGALHAIGESVSEMLDWMPAQLRVVPSLARNTPAAPATKSYKRRRQNG